MIKKFRRLAQKINENNRKIINLESHNAEIEKWVKENYWANVFNSAVKGNNWLDNISLNIGRWAGSYSLFYVLFRILNEVKPENILELGLGETTKMIQAYKKFHNKRANCITIEQNQEWIDLRLQNDISEEFVSVMLVDIEPLKVNGSETLAYKNLPDQLEARRLKFDLILIDGPWGSPNYSRFNIVGLIHRQLISDDFIIIMDDFNRKGEQETVKEITKSLDEMRKRYVTGKYNGEKELSIIASEKYKYLCTL